MMTQQNNQKTPPENPVTEKNAPQRSLTEIVASQLRDMIVEDRLKPGERIREHALANQLNVSRTPLREALKLLDWEGLVRLYPNRGAVVTRLTSDEVKEKLDVLGVLEGLGGRLACRNAADEEISEIQALHYEMCAAYSRGNRLAYFKLNQRIHSGIVAASCNLTLVETHSRINAQLYRIRFQSNLKNVHWSTAISEHEKILNALVARDEEALSNALQDHLCQTFFKFNQNVECGNGD